MSTVSRPGPIVVVVNPTKFDGLGEVRQELSRLGTEHEVEIRVVETTEDDPGFGQTRAALDQGAAVVCALGGDGTVRAVAQELAGGVDGARGDRVPTLARLPRQHPLPPVARPHLRPEPCLLPWSVVHPDLNRGDTTRGHRPGDATDGHRPRGRRVAAAGYVDAGLRLDRRVDGPPALGPVGRLRGIGRRRQPRKPLRGADEAVEPGCDQTHREAVLGRKCRPVHPHDEKGLAVVEQCLDRGRDRHTVDRGAQDLVHLSANSGSLQDVSHWHASPTGRADVGAAHLVAHTVDRHVPLDEVHGEQFCPSDDDLVIDHPVDRQRPRGDIHPRNRQRRVDPIELIPRSAQRADPPRRRLETWRQGSCRRARRGERLCGHGARSPTGQGGHPTDRQGTDAGAGGRGDETAPARSARPAHRVCRVVQW